MRSVEIAYTARGGVRRGRRNTEIRATLRSAFGWGKDGLETYDDEIAEARRVVESEVKT